MRKSGRPDLRARLAMTITSASRQMMNVREEHVLPRLRLDAERSDVVHELRHFQQVLRRGAEIESGLLEDRQDLVDRGLLLGDLEIDFGRLAAILVDHVD